MLNFLIDTSDIFIYFINAIKHTIIAIQTQNYVLWIQVCSEKTLYVINNYVIYI